MSFRYRTLTGPHIYRGRVESPQPFVPNDEMSDGVWWNPRETLADLFPIDAALAMLCPE
jgi:8-oxo-dGTP diphosphatase